jgi:hypothetical protein
LVRAISDSMLHFHKLPIGCSPRRGPSHIHLSGLSQYTQHAAITARLTAWGLGQVSDVPQTQSPRLSSGSHMRKRPPAHIFKLETWTVVVKICFRPHAAFPQTAYLVFTAPRLITYALDHDSACSVTARLTAWGLKGIKGRRTRKRTRACRGGS